jgi:Calcium binding
MAPEDECEREMFVLIRSNDRDLAVPLAQLDGVATDEDAQQGIDDWHYWIARGYRF